MSLYKFFIGGPSADEVRRIKVGTSIEEVRAALGKPDHITEMDGTLEWQYFKTFSWMAAFKFKDGCVASAYFSGEP
jgi:outer membrane protein assembly factor BamE (lipoprotein component of BamABCDE complex)